MKHLKKFENFDLGHRFTDEYEEENQYKNLEFEDEEECEPCSDENDEFNNDFEEQEGQYDFESEVDDFEEEEEEEEKDWNDEEELRLERVDSFRSFNEKKMNPGFKAYLDKKKAKSKGKDDKKGGKGKPDFLDLDKDGDKKETMKKAAKDAKDDKDDKGKKGLTAGQKRLPKAMQDAILKKQK
jgi:hypothetical protein